jgi:hypothetical protein
VSLPARIPWDRFSRDPRVPSYAGLRASDLDREEYDARVAIVQASKTMGELVPPLRDLVPSSLPVDLREQALAGYRAGFPWPVFVSLFTGVNLARVVANKQQIVEQKRAKLERKRRKELGP